MHVESLVNYLYRFDYNGIIESSNSSKLCFHVEMCILADKYDIQGLVKLSATKFEVITSQFRYDSQLIAE